VIYCMPGHAENLAADSAVDVDIASIKIVGLGWGVSRPTFTATAIAGDFKLATDMAILKALVATDTKLLEPMLAFRITAPAASLGKVTGDVVNMRGTFEPAAFDGDRFVLRGRLPLASSMDYAIRLSSITAGRGAFSTWFDGYQDCPPGLGMTRAYKGISPLDRAKYILWWRGALTDSIRG